MCERSSRRAAHGAVDAVSSGGDLDPGGDFLQQVDFVRAQEPPASGLEAFQRDRPDGDARQSHDLVAELREHPAHFAVLPLGEHKLHHGRVALVRDRLRSLGPNFSFREPNAIDELLQNFRRRGSRDHRAIHLLDAELGVSQAVGHLPVVREQHQPSAHLVETAHRVDALGDLGDEVDDSRTSRRIVIR